MLELIARGLTNPEIAGVLGIARATVKAHVAAVIEALDVTNRTEAAMVLRESGLSRAEGSSRPIPGFGTRPAIAVLPFDNLSSEADQDVFADGLVEDLTTRLATLRWFPVIARNSAFAFRETPAGPGMDIDPLIGPECPLFSYAPIYFPDPNGLQLECCRPTRPFDADDTIPRVRFRLEGRVKKHRDGTEERIRS